MRKTIQVAAAVIRSGDRILATQRGYGEFKDWWEFPGGKIEPGETPQTALRREIQEELEAEIRIGDLLDQIEYDCRHRPLSMTCYWAELASDSWTLLEHEAARWLRAEDLEAVNWLPADVGILEKIKKALTERLPLRRAEHGSF